MTTASEDEKPPSVSRRSHPVGSLTVKKFARHAPGRQQKNIFQQPASNVFRCQPLQRESRKIGVVA
jgi:hypothetical protein